MGCEDGPAVTTVSTPDFWGALGAAARAAPAKPRRGARGPMPSAGSLYMESLALGKPPYWLPQLLRRRDYPRRLNDLLAIAERYGLPPEWVETWWVDAAQRRSGPFTEKREAVERACARAGIELGEAAHLGRVRLKTLSRWTETDVDVDRRPLSRVVNALNAPELYDVIPSRWYRYELTCRRCSQTVSRPLGRIKRYTHDPALNEACGTGLYTCQPCLRPELGFTAIRARWQRITKRGGAQLRRKVVLARLDTSGLALGPATNKGRPLTPEHRWKTAIGLIRLRPSGQFGRCRICHYWTYVAVAGYPHQADTHAVCLSEHRHNEGFSTYPNRSRGRQLNSGELAVSFALAVAHLIKGYDVGRTKEEGGRGLAASLGVDENTVHYRIGRLLKTLPPDDRGDHRLAFWGRALRWAKSHRDLQAWANSNGWRWSRVLSQLRRLANIFGTSHL